MVRPTRFTLTAALGRRRVILPLFFLIFALLSSMSRTLPDGTGRAQNSAAQSRVVRTEVALISPAIGTIVEGPPTFRWKLSGLPAEGQRVLYTLKVVELQPEQTLDEAIEKNRAVLVTDKLTQDSFQFPGRGTDVLAGKVFAWRVTAYDLNGTEISRSGASFFAFGSWPPWSFCYLFLYSTNFDYCIGQASGVTVGFAFMSGSSTYTWTLTPAGGSGSSASPIITIPASALPTTPGTYSYTLTVTGGTCTRSANITITASNAPTAGTAWVSAAIQYTDPPNWQPSINICCGTAWKLKLDPPIVGTIVGTIQWQRSTNGGVTFTNVPGATGASVNVNPDPSLCSATQPIQYRAVVSTSNPPCNDYVSNVVTVNISPPSQVGTVTASPSAICNDTTSTSLINLTGLVVGAVTWYQNPGCTPNGWMPFTPSVPFNVGPLQQTTCYKAVVQSGACPAVESVATVVVDQKPVAGLITATPPAICPGDVSVLTLTGYSGLVQWYASTNIFNLFNNPIPGATNNTTQNTNILSQPGYYYYGVTVSSPNGVCTPVKTQVSVLVKPLPGPVTISAPGYICVGGSATLNVTSGGGAGTYQWFCDGAPCGPNSPTMTVTEPGNYWVEFNNGCGIVESNIKTIQPDLLAVNITGPCCPCKGQKVKLCAQPINGVGPYTYSWSNGATTQCITIIASATTTYTVTVTDANGCQASKSFTITVCP